MTTVNATNIDNNIRDFIKKTNVGSLGPFIPLPEGKIFMKNTFGKLKNHIKNIFGQKDKFSPEAFIYLQQIWEHGSSDEKQQKDLTKMLVRQCTDFGDNRRSDLISFIRPKLFNMVGTDCLVQHFGDIKPENFENASSAQLEKMYKYQKKLSNEQKMALLKNPIFVEDEKFSPLKEELMSSTIARTVNVQQQTKNNAAAKVSTAETPLTETKTTVETTATPSKSITKKSISITQNNAAKTKNINVKTTQNPEGTELLSLSAPETTEEIPRTDKEPPAPETLETSVSKKKTPSQNISAANVKSAEKTPAKNVSAANVSAANVSAANVSATNVTAANVKSAEKTPSKNVSTAEATEAEPSILAKTVNKDVIDILQTIREHLARFNENSGVVFVNRDRILRVGDEETGIYEISVECLLHYLSGNTNFLSQFKDECKPAMENFKDEKGGLSLKSLMKLSKGENFTKDSEFYRNLYGFDVSVADFIANNPAFLKTDTNTQLNILSKYQNFVIESLNTLSEYMDKYKIIDDNLINSSYNLLYLANIITYRQVNVGKGVSDLTELYKQLVEAIVQNIKLYNSIDKSKLIEYKEVQGPVTEIDNLISELTRRLDLLQKQRVVLEQNVKAIESSAVALSGLASDDIKTIGTKLSDQIRTTNTAAMEPTESPSPKPVPTAPKRPATKKEISTKKSESVKAA